ncbi:MAG: hypothetical protein GF365_00165 [Candidatus Buchananbacteria bacterium]|nr:hypothetical protein [Candidatus Buchananbacteria bacterium]
MKIKKRRNKMILSPIKSHDLGNFLASKQKTLPGEVNYRNLKIICSRMLYHCNTLAYPDCPMGKLKAADDGFTRLSPRLIKSATKAKIVKMVNENIGNRISIMLSDCINRQYPIPVLLHIFSNMLITDIIIGGIKPEKADPIWEFWARHCSPNQITLNSSIDLLNKYWESQYPTVTRKNTLTSHFIIETFLRISLARISEILITKTTITPSFFEMFLTEINTLLESLFSTKIEAGENNDSIKYQELIYEIILWRQVIINLPTITSEIADDYRMNYDCSKIKIEDFDWAKNLLENKALEKILNLDLEKKINLWEVLRLMEYNKNMQILPLFAQFIFQYEPMTRTLQAMRSLRHLSLVKNTVKIKSFHAIHGNSHPQIIELRVTWGKLNRQYWSKERSSALNIKI